MNKKCTAQPVPDHLLNIMNMDDVGPDPESLARRILSELDDRGYVILRNVPIDPEDPASASAYFLDLAARIGQPVDHDGRNTLVWDIKKVEGSSSAVKTYSEHSDEAELHTDTQYRIDPEDFIALLTLVPAACGGGQSIMMTLSDIRAEIAARADGAAIVQALSNTQYPFVVPSVFNLQGTQEREYIHAPILQGEHIRFRIDTLEKALPVHRQGLSEQALQAFQVLKSIVLHSPRMLRFHLQPRDILFINNKTALHGRTAFTDARRHLLRIRINRHA